ncbi:DNA transposition protein [Vandammella animalimorsus]|uniref:DNA transposition protein n=1 Tax=Vandammella animalimorsus TaxID=2029117 RepID=A0A2A2AN79_9BURK|nr:AAA family ATPase [Vandammella animalimorsus]PAT39181.1 DNA transposition protein [Vandammella animalimorsus]
MKKGFVQTANFRLLKEAEAQVQRRGAREAGLVLIQGVYGIGKSELTERWATDNGHVFVRAKETWSKRTMLDELATKMGLSVRGTAVDVQNRIIGHLAVSMQALIIDEADHLVDMRSAAKLEAIRDITDMTGTMVFLVGMENLPAVVQRYEHIASRVARIVQLQPLTLADVQATVKAKAEVAISPALAEQIHRDSKGRMRLVLNAITNIEGWAQANSWAEVDVAHVKGQSLCTDFSGHLAARRRAA